MYCKCMGFEQLCERGFILRLILKHSFSVYLRPLAMPVV